jgi:hypothetical protein
VDVFGAFFSSCLHASRAEFQLHAVFSVRYVGIRVICSLGGLCASENGTPAPAGYQFALARENSILSRSRVHSHHKGRRIGCRHASATEGVRVRVRGFCAGGLVGITAMMEGVRESEKDGISSQ